MPRFDVVVIGSGPGGEGAAMNASKQGKSVAVIEAYAEVGGRELRLMFFVMSAISVGPYEGFLCWSGSLRIAFMFCALFLFAA